MAWEPLQDTLCWLVTEAARHAPSSRGSSSKPSVCSFCFLVIGVYAALAASVSADWELPPILTKARLWNAGKVAFSATWGSRLPD
jgi:hypothetical protein